MPKEKSQGIEAVFSRGLITKEEYEYLQQKRARKNTNTKARNWFYLSILAVPLLIPFVMHSIYPYYACQRQEISIEFLCLFLSVVNKLFFPFVVCVSILSIHLYTLCKNTLKTKRASRSLMIVNILLYILTQICLNGGGLMIFAFIPPLVIIASIIVIIHIILWLYVLSKEIINEIVS